MAQNEGFGLGKQTATAPRGEYEILPEDIYDAVIVALVDRGEQPNKFQDGKMQHKFDIVLQVEVERDGEVRRELIRDMYITASLHEKSKLGKIYSGLTGKPITPDTTLDYSKMPGTPARIVIKHVSRDDKTWAQVDSFMKPKRKLEVEGCVLPEKWLEGTRGVLRHELVKKPVAQDPDLDTAAGVDVGALVDDL